MLDDLAKTSQGQASQRMASATESATESLWEYQSVAA